MPMKIRISADSTCDLTSELIEQYDVKIAPLYILMDDRALRDGIECTREDIFADRKSTRLNSSHSGQSRMPSSA